jgi:hypothetical protein
VTTVDDDPQVERLEKQAERDRAELSETVGDLRDKISDTVSPAAIKQEVKDYVRESGEQLIETIRRRAYENPLQAVAVGAGLAYPLWRVIANVPVPVLMAGAGLALMRSGTSPATNKTGYATAAMHDTAKKTSDTIADAASALSHTVAGAADRMRTGIGDASEAAQASGEEIAHAIDRYPLIAGAIGLSIGALIGAAIPRTSAETELVGELSEDVQDRAREVMKSGAHTVKTAAAEVYQKAAQAADEQGLTGEQLREGLRDLQDQISSQSERFDQPSGKTKRK